MPSTRSPSACGMSALLDSGVKEDPGFSPVISLGTFLKQPRLPYYILLNALFSK